MDGVLADFASAFREVEERLYGTATSGTAPSQVEAEAEDAAAEEVAQESSPHEARRRRDAIWHAIRSTPDFWTTLKPLEPGAVRRIHEMMLRFGWEVCFITQRPATMGQTVQRQTQRWLHEQGFDLPSVLVINGSRGAAAGALRLHYMVDDSPQNCLDIVSDSRATPILIVPERDTGTEASARRLHIATARSATEALDAIERLTVSAEQLTLLDKLAKLVRRG